MSNNSVNKHYVPKLRFKEFKSNYNKKIINDCFVILNGLSGLKAKNFKHGNDKYITYKTAFNNWFINNNELEFFEKGPKKQNEVIKNDILITSSSETLNEIGYSSIYLDNEKVYLNSFCFILRNISNEVNSQYFNWLMKNKYYRKLIVNEGQGSTRYNLQKKQFMNILFMFPLLKEQEKISKFLCLLDKQILLLENKMKLTEQMKKYFLYKMFHHRNKFKLRFQEFNHLSTKNVQLISLVKLNKYKQILANEMELLISSKGDIKLLPSSKEYNWFSDLSAEDYRVNYGNVITLGRARYANIKKWKGYFISSNNIIVENKENVDFDYLYYLINKNKEKFYIEKTTYPVFSSEIFKEFDCSIPTNINEQIKIANFLSLFEKKENLINEQIKNLKKMKNFYLNNLFI